MRRAGISFDIDSVASHLAGYGFDRVPEDGAACRIAVPRILDSLRRHGARGTFFLVAGEARHHPEIVARIVSEGHEVASHSMTHRLPFTGLTEEDLAVEVGGSKALLESLADCRVDGFRAPSWDAGPRLLRALVEAGYRYDSSAYPSILLPLLRRSVARRSRGARRRTSRDEWSAVLAPAGPHLRQVDRQSLIELPMCTVPGVRLPYYHTLRFLAPGPVFDWIRRLAHARRGSVWYQFHAVDFLGLDEDRLDDRIARHPGMDLPLERKLFLADDSIAALARSGAPIPLRELLDHHFPSASPRTAARKEER